MLTCVVVRVGTTIQEAIDLRSGYPNGIFSVALEVVGPRYKFNGQGVARTRREGTKRRITGRVRGWTSVLQRKEGKAPQTLRPFITTMIT